MKVLIGAGINKKENNINSIAIEAILKDLSSLRFCRRPSLEVQCLSILVIFMFLVLYILCVLYFLFHVLVVLYVQVVTLRLYESKMTSSKYTH